MTATTTTARAHALKRQIMRVMSDVFDSILTPEERHLKDFVLMLVSQQNDGPDNMLVLEALKPYGLPEDIAQAFIAASSYYGEKLRESPADCKHLTQKGNRCRNAAIPGFNCCGTHLGR